MVFNAWERALAVKSTVHSCKLAGPVLPRRNPWDTCSERKRWVDRFDTAVVEFDSAWLPHLASGTERKKRIDRSGCPFELEGSRVFPMSFSAVRSIVTAESFKREGVRIWDVQRYDRIEALFCMWLRVPPAADLHSVIAKERSSTPGMSAFDELQQSRKRFVERRDLQGQTTQMGLPSRLICSG